MLRILNLAASESYEEIRNAPEFRAISRTSHLPSRLIYERLRNFMRHEVLREDDFSAPPDVSTAMKQVVDLLAKYFPMHVIYLPTYRRIEQDLKSLLNVESEPAELAGFIHFGMGDIKTKLNSVAEKIRDHFVLSYGKTSGQMLGQLTESIQITSQMRAALANLKEVEIVLGRVGQNISADVRNRILTMIEDGTITNNQHLSFFIFQLMDAYEAVREFRQSSMRAFANVCNSYLVNKKFRYNSVNATIQLYNTVTDPSWIWRGFHPVKSNFLA